MPQHIAVLGSFDTKAEELGFLRDGIRRIGCTPVCVDTSLGGQTSAPTDVSAREVAAAAGLDIDEIRSSRDTHAVTQGMIRGASKVIVDLFRSGRLDGIVAIGGASNTGLATAVMGALPFGVPKVMVSSMAAVPAYAGSYFGTKDIAVFHSVVDVAGLNPLLKNVLERAAGAVCGMAEAGSGALELACADPSRPRVAITEFKFSEKCCKRAASILTEAGAEVMPFHAQGIGDRAMEELIDQGLIDGVLDVVPAGLAEELLGGNRSAGPDRLEAAGRRGVPQVITPCGFDMLSCGPLERRDRGDALWVSRSLSGRKLFLPDALRVQARTTAEELVAVADTVADRLGRATGPTVVLIPAQGWSSLSEAGMPLCDFEADAAFVHRLRERAPHNVEIRQLDLPLNTEAFAEVAAGELLRLMGLARSTKPGAETATPRAGLAPPSSRTTTATQPGGQP